MRALILKTAGDITAEHAKSAEEKMMDSWILRLCAQRFIQYPSHPCIQNAV
jgi:hypothetical protein